MKLLHFISRHLMKYGNNYKAPVKHLIRVVSIFMLVWVALPACNLLSGAAQPVDITFYKRGYVEGGTDVTSKNYAKAIEAFEKRNSHIKVKIVGVPWDSEGDALMEAVLESGEDVNVFNIRPDNLLKLSKAGKLSNIEPFLTEEEYTDFYPNALQAATVDGKVYAWPLWVVAFSIFANTDILADRGITPPSIENPWTWEEFLTAAEQLTFEREDGSKVYGFTAPSVWWSMQYYPLFYLDGGRILSPDGKRFAQNQPEAVSGLQKIANLYQDHQITPPGPETVSQADAQTQFRNGEAAMIMSMPAFIAELEDEQFPVKVLPIPTGELNQLVTTGAFGMFAVYNTDDPAKLEASHELAKYLTGPQVAKDVPGYQLAPSLRRSNTSYATTSNRETITQLLEFGIFEAQASIPNQLRDRYREALKQIAQGEISPREAMDNIAPAYQQALDETWK